jgi:prepilin-type processing-associated H-X9-DG protein
MSEGDAEGRAYVAELRAQGVSDARITRELLKAGWPLPLIGTLLGPAPDAAPAPGGGYAMSPDASPEYRGGSGLAAMAFVLGVIGLVFFPLALIGLILGIIALALGRPGRSMATGAIVLGLLAPLLAAVFFPVFAQPRAKASQNPCLSNVKQMQLGLIMYASDNNQTYPPLEGYYGSMYWPTAILPYIKNVQIFLCPSDTIVTGSIVLPPPNNPTNISYGRNSFMGLPGISDAKITYPAEMLGVMDAVSPTLNYNAPFSIVQKEIGSMTEPVTIRHNSGCNQSYMDGHVKWIAFANIPDTISGSPPPGSVNKHYWQGKD